jgi:hypothetical protein
LSRTRLTRRNHPAESWLGKGGEEEGDRTERIKRERVKTYNYKTKEIQTTYNHRNTNISDKMYIYT